MKNVIIRSGLVALSLTIGVLRMAEAATYSPPQQPVAGQQIPQRLTGVPAGRTYASQSSIAIGADDRIGNMNTPALTHNSTVQTGNNFNWLGGGGG